MNLIFGNGVIVRDSVASDVDSIAKDMRQSDKNEVWASHRHDPLEAVGISFHASTLCFTIECEGKKVGMFGVVPHTLLGQSGNIWLLCTKEFDRCHRKLIRHSRGFIQYMLQHYAELENFVDARNTKSIAWLRFCGAEIGPAIPFGVDGLPFHRFHFRRKPYALAS